MKRFFTLLTFLLVFLFSCTTDFEINGPWQDITVVYGLLNQNDSITYIKINKAFLGEGNALMMAQIEDSCEYQHPLEVKVEEWSNNNLVKTFFFDTTTVYNKEPGVFYYPKQVLYKAVTYKQLNVESTYKLIIHNPVSGNTYRSQTLLVYPLSISKPLPSLKIISFSQETGSIGKVEWTTGQNGRKFQLLIRFNYKEVPVSGGTDTTFKSVDWLFPAMRSPSLTGHEVMFMTYPNPYFYDLLRSKIAVNTSVRRFIGKKGFNESDLGAVEFIFSVAAEEFSTYLDVYVPSTGIVQEKPDYTNIIGDGGAKGVGIFSSRYQYTKPFKLDDATRTNIQGLNLGF